MCALGAALHGCGLAPPPGYPAQLAPTTQAERSLHDLPPPVQPIIVAVYEFPDKTGQHKPNDQFTEYSRAVTQGGAEMLIEALQEAGGGRWFIVLERAGLNNLLRERHLIRSTREEYLGPDGQPLAPPPPLLYAPIMIEGAITAYETNTYTGGIGARFLGMGANSSYEHDRVTVSVRASSTQNGRILRSVSATKDIFSFGLQGGVFRFVDFDELLEAETGITTNEPPQLAVRRAIEKAVHALILEGALTGVWSFADPDAAAPLISAYLAERDDGVLTAPLDPEAPGRLAPPAERADVQEPRPERNLAEELEQRLREQPDIYDRPPPTSQTQSPPDPN